MSTRVLITGASIAGCALAWWLERYGLDVTVMERAQAFRDGGQNIDVRGAARTVLQRMDLEQAVAERGTGERGIAFVDADNRVHAQFDAEQFGSNGPTAELEILRGDLARLLYDESQARCTYRFGDRVTEVNEVADGINVTLEQGGLQHFDLLLVAEGIGSSTRQIVIGDAARRVPLGLYMGYFTIPLGENDSSLARWFNAPGGRSIFLRPDPHGATRAVLTYLHAPNGAEKLDPAEQKALLRRRFADAGWEVERVLFGMDSADDFYFEQIGQIKAPTWSHGRTALTGDAAWCASPLSGFGTSLALVGAYVLAGELAQSGDHAAAFAAYERILRPFVDQAQDVPKLGPRLAQPQTRLGITLQHAALNVATRPGIRALTGKLFSPPGEKIALPLYSLAGELSYA